MTSIGYCFKYDSRANPANHSDGVTIVIFFTPVNHFFLSCHILFVLSYKEDGYALYCGQPQQPVFHLSHFTMVKCGHCPVNDQQSCRVHTTGISCFFEYMYLCDNSCFNFLLYDYPISFIMFLQYDSIGPNLPKAYSLQFFFAEIYASILFI